MNPHERKMITLAQAIPRGQLAYYYTELSNFLTLELGLKFEYREKLGRLDCLNAATPDMVKALRSLGYGILKPRHYRLENLSVLIYKGRKVPLAVSGTGYSGTCSVEILGMTLPRWDEILKGWPLNPNAQTRLEVVKGFSAIYGNRSNRDHSALNLDKWGFEHQARLDYNNTDRYYSEEHKLTLILHDRSAGYHDFVLADTTDYRNLM